MGFLGGVMHDVVMTHPEGSCTRLLPSSPPLLRTHMTPWGRSWPFGAWLADDPSGRVLACLLGACHPHDPSGHVTSLTFLTCLLGVRLLHFSSDPVLSMSRSDGVTGWIWSARRIGANRILLTGEIASPQWQFGSR